ncbi:hypothetical protein [Nonomuraea sp. NPDC048826]
MIVEQQVYFVIQSAELDPGQITQYRASSRLDLRRRSHDAGGRVDA